MAVMQVFLSHSSADRAVAEKLVAALEGANANVWFDVRNLGPVALLKEISREIHTRPVFLILLSEQAIASPWVQQECEWAVSWYIQDHSRIVLPIVIAPLEPTSLPDEMPYLTTFKRIEGPNHAPYPERETLAETLRLLALTPAGQPPAPVTPQPTETVDDLLTQGKALAAQKRWAEALPFFQRATERDPRNATAWGELGHMLTQLTRYEEALPACDRSLALNEGQTWVWNNKGVALNGLTRSEEALEALDRALALDPANAYAWNNMGLALYGLKHYEEALAACDRSLALDPDNAAAWNNKGYAFLGLRRYVEAVAAIDRALTLNPTSANYWDSRGEILLGAGRYQESVDAYNEALGRDPSLVPSLIGKAKALRMLGRTAEAEAAERRAKELGG